MSGMKEESGGGEVKVTEMAVRKREKKGGKKRKKKGG